MNLIHKRQKQIGNYKRYYKRKLKRMFIYQFLALYVDKTDRLVYMKFGNQITICESYKKSYKKLL